MREPIYDEGYEGFEGFKLPKSAMPISDAYRQLIRLGKYLPPIVGVVFSDQ